MNSNYLIIMLLAAGGSLSAQNPICVYWAKYAAIYDSKYKPALYNRVGYVNIPMLLEKTEADIKIATDWKPGTIKEYILKTRTEVPFKK